MALTLKDPGQGSQENDNKKAESTYNSPVNPDYIKADPIVLSKPDLSIESNMRKESSSDKVIGILKLVIPLLILIIGGKLIYDKLTSKPKDVTDIVKSDETAIEKELGITLENNDAMVHQIHQYSRGKVTVSGNGDIGVIYIDGKQVGLHINNKKYGMYGVAIGDAMAHAEKDMKFDYNKSTSVLDDALSGKSMTWYYYNTETNEAIALTENETTARVVAITYFSDFHKVTENLEGISD